LPYRESCNLIVHNEGEPTANVERMKSAIFAKLSPAAAARIV
jgi:hypothetical protein